MIRKSLYGKGLILVATGMLLLTACRRTATDTNSLASLSEDDKGYGADQALIERENNDVISMADAAAANGSAQLKGGLNELSGCAVVTNDTLASPHVLTIDFGNSPCTGIDGRNRSGKIMVQYTGQYKDAGSQHTITYDNYVVNGNQITGSKTVTNMGMNNAGDYYYNIAVTDTLWSGTVANNNGFRSWTSSRVRTWVSGYSTGTRTDDSYDITGNATIRRINGHAFTVNITSALRVAIGCPWIEQGTVEITPQNGNVRTIDYGSGNCDSEATLTVNNQTYHITL
ncbi:MAG: hypothetical protein BGO69_15450 [Bacteroidetes bacterium 46-16]|nr:MAG: hypothetical protein BGO69_15450 [Bacteroidetes bacterium 46-16]